MGDGVGMVGLRITQVTCNLVLDKLQINSVTRKNTAIKSEGRFGVGSLGHRHPARHSTRSNVVGCEVWESLQAMRPDYIHQIGDDDIDRIKGGAVFCILRLYIGTRNLSKMDQVLLCGLRWNSNYVN